MEPMGSEVQESAPEEIVELRRQVKRLQWAVFGVWPVAVLGLATVGFVFSRGDAAATRTAIKWVEGTAWNLLGFALVLGLVVGSVAFVAKLSMDYRNRHYKWSLNPGSKRRGEMPVAAQAGRPEGKFRGSAE